MTVPPDHALRTLDYATPAARRHWQLRTWMPLAAAAVFGGIAIVVPEDIGSGRFIYNPLRELASMGTIASLVAYVWLRAVNDTERSRARPQIFAGLALVASVAVYVTYYNYNAVRHEPHFSIRNPYFRFVLTLFVTAAFVSASQVAQSRGRRLTTRWTGSAPRRAFWHVKS